MQPTARWTIVLLMAASAALVAQGAWVDPSPHVQKRIAVDGGTTLEVLDWKGTGRPLILLAQLGQTAHIYDDWAVTLARDFHVLAITRRGYGESASGGGDYSTARLAQDVVAVIDAEQLRKPLLVGHGLAGEELSWIGEHAADRIGGLVYLDAAYDRRSVGAEAAIAKRIPAEPGAAPDMSSVQTVAAWMSIGVGGAIPEAEVRQIATVAPDGRVTGERSSSGAGAAVRAQLTPVDPSGIRVPVLAMYAVRTSVTALPGCRAPTAPSVAAACHELFDWMTMQLERSKRSFGGIAAPVRVVDLPGANSFMFLSNGAAVARAVTAFNNDLAR